MTEHEKNDDALNRETATGINAPTVDSSGSAPELALLARRVGAHGYCAACCAPVDVQIGLVLGDVASVIGPMMCERHARRLYSSLALALNEPSPATLPSESAVGAQDSATDTAANVAQKDVGSLAALDTERTT